MAYEVGLSTLPERMIVEYIPFEVYMTAKFLITTTHWFFACALVTCLPFAKMFVRVTIVVSFLCFVEFCGVFFIVICIVESKGKNLLQIQTEFGGNPVGHRRAHRRRKTYGETRETVV